MGWRPSIWLPPWRRCSPSRPFRSMVVSTAARTWPSTWLRRVREDLRRLFVVGSSGGRCLRLLALFLCAAMAVAAEPVAVPAPGPPGSPLPLDERLVQAIAALHRYPRWCGLLLAGL